MNRSRMLRSATLLSVLLAYGATAFGLGLGELQLSSSLNQNFRAEISLTNASGLAPEEILPVLASQKDFDRYGVERSYLLTDLRFSIRSRSDGSYYIEIVSSRPIQEPFLNFIVEVLWPNGKILREFTVLLDPPVFGDTGVAPIEPAATVQGGRQATSSSRPATASSRPATASSRPATVSSRPATVSSRPATPESEPRASKSSPMTEGEIVDTEYGVTGPGDTLWGIALKVRPNDSVTVQQTMLALQRMNPEAFINNNINLLKAGHVLRIPSAGDLNEASRNEAIAEVRAQNLEFEQYRSGGVAQLDATRRQRTTPAGTGAGDSGELKLLAANRTSGQRAGDSDARVTDLENELAIAREDLDKARRANTELNVRMDDLSNQLETLNEIVRLKDDQMAAWRAELEKAQLAGDAAPGAAPVAPTAPVEQGSLLTNPIVLVGLLVVVIGGVVAGMILMRKRKEDTGEIADDFAEVPASDEPLAEQPVETEVAAEDAAEVEDEVDEDLSQQTEDVLSEAEIYIAYGRFPQAITFLQNAVEAEPDRADIQLKLLEVFVQTEDATAFNLQFEQLKALGDAEAIEAATALQSQIPGAAETAQVAMDATIVSSEPIEAIVEIEDDDDDLSFDLDDLDAETEDDELDLGDALDLDDEEEVELELVDTELDIDLDADDTLALDAEELDLDLDLDDFDDSKTLAADELDLGDGDDLDLADDEISLEKLDEEVGLAGDDGISLDEELADDDITFEDDLGLNTDEEVVLDDLDLGEELDADGAISLDLDADDDFNLEDELGGELTLDDDDDAISLDLDAEDDFSLEDDLNLEAEEVLDLEDDDGISLDLDDDEISLDLDDDLGELNLDEDSGSKLDLARAYIDMGDHEGARSLLTEVVSEGLDSEIQEASELLEKLD